MPKSLCKCVIYTLRDTLEDFEGLPEFEGDEDEEEKRDPRYILGRKLLSLGKVNYRHIEHVPDWINLRVKVMIHYLIELGQLCIVRLLIHLM